jgi:hypothetical protein
LSSGPRAAIGEFAASGSGKIEVKPPAYSQLNKPWPARFHDKASTAVGGFGDL